MEQFIQDNLFQIIGFVSMLVGLYVTSDKTQAVFKAELTHVKEDVARLEQKQDKYNNVIQRTYKLEAEVAALKRELENG